MLGDRLPYTLLRSGAGRWTGAGPGHCGFGERESLRTLEPGSTLGFVVSPDAIGPGQSGTYRVMVSIREQGSKDWVLAVSRDSFALENLKSPEQQ